VAVLVRPAQYSTVLDELRGNGAVSDATRRRLAAEAFAHTAACDTAGAASLAGDADADGMPEEFSIGVPRLAELRYGENPHQRGALYAIPGAPGGLAHARQLQGPALSFTNWLDVDSARRIVAAFEGAARTIIQATNP